MIITVTAPRKGLGQTITAINIAALCSKLKNKTLIVDTNKYCRDIEYYLSDTAVTKGLDEFISLQRTNLLCRKSFDNCIKTVNKHLDIMAPNDYMGLDRDAVKELAAYIENIYDITVIDSISGSNDTTRMFLEYSDVIVAVINQSKNVVALAGRNEMYRKHKDKIVFVLNKHIVRYDNKKIQYTLESVTTDLREAGFSNPIYALSYDIDVVNECNSNAVLNFVLNQEAERTYNKQLKKLVEGMVSASGEQVKEERNIRAAEFRKHKLFGFI